MQTMPTRRTLIILVGALALALGACGSSGDTDSPGGGGDTPAGAAAKADCPDCDPAGPNAFVQTGIGSGFYTVGDHWQVAFRYVHKPMAERRADVFLGTDVADSEAFLFEYDVTGVSQQVFDNVQREVATIEITQGTPAGPDGDLFTPERIDTYEHKVVFRMNDLLDPTSEKLFNREYPHGKLVHLDQKSSLQMGASLFPRTIPRLLVSGAVDAPAPELPADLEDIADAMVDGWRTRTYKRYTFDNGDLAYWTQDSDQYWPFYVRNVQGHGVLVGWNH